MIIYADILFLLNAFINYILLLICALVLRAPLKRRRFLAASLLGGVYALSILIELHPILDFFLKVAVCLCIVWIAYGKMKLRLYLTHCFLFLLLNVLLGGLMLLLAQWNARDFYSNGYVGYMHISPLYFVIALALCYAAVNVLTRFILKKRNAALIYRVMIEFHGRQYRLYGFCDSGNQLSEPFSAEPVSIVKTGILKEWEQEPLKRVIPFSSLGGDGVLYAVKVKLKIYDRQKQLLEREAYIVQSDSAFRDMQYDILLNPQLFSEMEYL
ncbi:MAG: sigma-E processing peptidase SpoIIGA [Clostridia bacterium]|nr:sigma-E processing peptidase SpoIIGA [Clostridia bacterium]